MELQADALSIVPAAGPEPVGSAVRTGDLPASGDVGAIINARDNKKERVEDKEFYAGIRDTDLSRKELVRVYAVDQVFIKVSFKQSNFLCCYFRKCKFIECDFTGASIRDSNFKGAQFEACKWQYTIWEKTLLDEGFLDSCLPSEENLARDLVRSLRTNFAQIGNYEAVNKAASIEVKLTGQHLYNAAYSRQSYYRGTDKYRGKVRLTHALQHLKWKSLDLLWGNGESIFRVARSGLIVILIGAGLFKWSFPGVSFFDSFLEVFGHFWGVQYHSAMPWVYDVTLTVLRFVIFGLFMAILVKRLSRR